MKRAAYLCRTVLFQVSVSSVLLAAHSKTLKSLLPGRQQERARPHRKSTNQQCAKCRISIWLAVMDGTLCLWRAAQTARRGALQCCLLFNSLLKTDQVQQTSALGLPLPHSSTRSGLWGSLLEFSNNGGDEPGEPLTCPVKIMWGEWRFLVVNGYKLVYFYKPSWESLKRPGSVFHMQYTGATRRWQ